MGCGGSSSTLKTSQCTPILTFFQFCNYLASLLNSLRQQALLLHLDLSNKTLSRFYSLQTSMTLISRKFQIFYDHGNPAAFKNECLLQKGSNWPHIDLKTTTVWSNVAITKRAHTSTNQWCLFCSHNAYTICSRHPNKTIQPSYLITRWTQHAVAKNIHIGEPRKESEHPWVLDMVKRWASSSETVSSNICWVAQVANILHSASVFKSNIFWCVFCY